MGVDQTSTKRRPGPIWPVRPGHEARLDAPRADARDPTRSAAQTGPRACGPRGFALAHLGRRDEPPHVDLADDPLDLLRVDEAGAEALHGVRAAGHAEAQALRRRL